MDTPASHKTTPQFPPYRLADWSPSHSIKEMSVHTRGMESLYKPVSVLVKCGEMRLWYPVPLKTSAFPSVPCICDRSLWHRKTLLGSAMSLSLPSSHLQTPQLPETRSWQHRESTRFLCKPTKQWEICLFSVFWDVFLKETQEKEQCGWFSARLCLLKVAAVELVHNSQPRSLEESPRDPPRMS